MSERQERSIVEALEKVFRNYNSDAGPVHKDRRTGDFVFHMTDWYDDLLRLSELYRHPEKHGRKEWNDAVAGFLYHAVGHLLAAAKLNNTFSDPFEAAPHVLKRLKKSKRLGKSKALKVS